MERLEDLPGHLRERILRLGIPNPERFATVPFPSLGDRTITEALSEPGGEEAVLALLARIAGYLGRASA